MGSQVGEVRSVVAARPVMAATYAVLRRPSLWGTAINQIRILAHPGWWRRPPFLPLPDPAYLRFRLETAYGGDSVRLLRPEDVVTYLSWCRAWRRSLN
jgi:hypothetical protein